MIGATALKKMFGTTRRKNAQRSTTPSTAAPTRTPRRGFSILPQGILFIDEKVCVGCWVLRHDARPTHNRRKRIKRHLHRHPEHLGEHLRESAQEGSAAKDGHAALEHVGEELGRRLFYHVLHRLQESIEGRRERLADMRVGKRDLARETRGEVATAYTPGE